MLQHHLHSFVEYDLQLQEPEQENKLRMFFFVKSNFTSPFFNHSMFGDGLPLTSQRSLAVEPE